jgi:hypothetical protein
LFIAELWLSRQNLANKDTYLQLMTIGVATVASTATDVPVGDAHNLVDGRLRHYRLSLSFQRNLIDELADLVAFASVNGRLKRGGDRSDFSLQAQVTGALVVDWLTFFAPAVEKMLMRSFSKISSMNRRVAL